MHSFLEVGYHLHTNNWYTSLPLQVPTSAWNLGLWHNKEQPKGASAASEKCKVEEG